MDRIKEFFDEILIADTETTGVELDDDIIEFSASFPDSTTNELLNYTVKYKPTKSVPAESSAVNWITDEDLVDCISYTDDIELLDTLFNSKKYYVGHNVQFDRSMLMCNHERFSGNIPDYMIADNKWICTLRLTKKLYAQDPDFSNLKLSYLWFKFGLHKTCDRKIVPHSAEDDVFMCYKVLEHLVNVCIELGHIDPQGNVGEQLVAFCNKPIRYTIMPFGKHKNEKMSNVPKNYLQWMIMNSDILDETKPNFDPDFAYTVQLEYESRIN